MQNTFLNQYGVIELIGDNALTFLQGQITCDVRKLDAQPMIRGAFCNLKGRILAMADVIRWQNIMLVMHQEVLEPTLSSLSKIAPLSQVKVQLRDDLQVIGVVSTDEPQEALFAYAIDDNRWIAFIHTNRATTVRDNDLQWHCLDLLARRFDITASTRGLFMPHRLDLQLTDVLSFDKGCYKGQEIIARTHYKATLKHHLELLKVPYTKSLIAGAKIFHQESQQELGEIIDVAKIDTASAYALVSILKIHPETGLIENSSDSISFV